MKELQGKTRDEVFLSAVPLPKRFMTEKSPVEASFLFYNKE